VSAVCSDDDHDWRQHSLLHFVEVRERARASLSLLVLTSTALTQLMADIPHVLAALVTLPFLWRSPIMLYGCFSSCSSAYLVPPLSSPIADACAAQPRHRTGVAWCATSLSSCWQTFLTSWPPSLSSPRSGARSRSRADAGLRVSCQPLSLSPSPPLPLAALRAHAPSPRAASGEQRREVARTQFVELLLDIPFFFTAALISASLFRMPSLWLGGA
jgi:hypothetical protein